MPVAHATHNGIEGCLRRVRECLFWPMMASDVKEYVSKCDVCLAHRESQTKVPLLRHKVVARPWAKLAANLCKLHGHTLLVVSDYFSNCTSKWCVFALPQCKLLFPSRRPCLRILVTDEPQFSSNEFQVFKNSWSLNDVTTSPRYPQSNGKAENAVWTVKRLFEKYKETGASEFQALLDWQNTPLREWIPVLCST